MPDEGAFPPGARVTVPTLPAPLDAYNKRSAGVAETIFHGRAQTAPPHLAWFLQQLAREVQQELFGSQRIFFNERSIVPGRRLVAAGECTQHPGGVDVLPAGDRASFRGGAGRRTAG